MIRQDGIDDETEKSESLFIFRERLKRNLYSGSLKRSVCTGSFSISILMREADETSFPEFSKRKAEIFMESDAVFQTAAAAGCVWI